jgi:hypothetical protein
MKIKLVLLSLFYLIAFTVKAQKGITNYGFWYGENWADSVAKYQEISQYFYDKATAQDDKEALKYQRFETFYQHKIDSVIQVENAIIEKQIMLNRKKYLETKYHIKLN